jgi:hypothetical protein
MSDKLKILHDDLVIYIPGKKPVVFSLSKEERDFLLELKRIFCLNDILVVEEDAKD